MKCPPRFGTPPEGFTIRWVHHELCRERLGYKETASRLRDRLTRCHPSAREIVERELADAERGVGPTDFDWLIDVIRDHGPGGRRPQDNVTLDLA